MQLSPRAGLVGLALCSLAYTSSAAPCQEGRLLAQNDKLFLREA